MRWQHLLTQSAELFLKPTCLNCDRPHQNFQLCNACASSLQNDRVPNDQCYQDSSANRVFAWGYYQNTLRRLLQVLKYDDQPAIADVLGQQLAQAWMQYPFPRLTVVPIPLHADRQATRGYNQAELIARSFCRYTGLPLWADALVRSRNTTAQYELTATQRQQNLQSAFALNQKSLKYRPRSPILLIDDIYTTGTTVAAASETLRQAGRSVWGVAVVARGMDLAR
jgi:ComF family protein